MVTVAAIACSKSSFFLVGVLCRSSLPVESIVHSRYAEYNAAFTQSIERADSCPMIEFMLRAVRDTMLQQKMFFALKIRSEYKKNPLPVGLAGDFCE